MDDGMIHLTDEMSDAIRRAEAEAAGLSAEDTEKYIQAHGLLEIENGRLVSWCRPWMLEAPVIIQKQPCENLRQRMVYRNAEDYIS